MIQILHPGCRCGQISAPVSKSALHRQLICASLSDSESRISLNHPCDDIQTTIDCLNALGAEIAPVDSRSFNVTPITRKVSDCHTDLYCKESGSTLRFLLPLTIALGKKVRIHMSDRLAERPMYPLIEVLTNHGAEIKKKGTSLICQGQLDAGIYTIPGNISSQYISGLLFALPLLENDSRLIITETIESEPYINLTEQYLLKSGIRFKKDNNQYEIPGKQAYCISGAYTVEKDWSNAAIFLCMGAFSPTGITLKGPDPHSVQGDRKILDILTQFGARVKITADHISVCKGHLTGQIIDAKNIPDLIPAISVLAAGSKGTTQIINAQRLRMKESDRIKSTAAMLSALGAEIRETSDGLLINGKEKLKGGQCQSANDHRIAMAAAIAACISDNAVVIKDAEAVSKSYPDFWDDIRRLKIL